MAPVKAIVAMGLALGAGVARADLNQIPTADIYGHRQGLLELLAEGTERRVDKRYYFSHRVRVGLLDRVEVGYSNDFLGESALNVKVRVKTWKHVTVSVGSEGMRRGLRADVYAVGLYELPTVRFHAGVLQNDRFQAMLGVDFDLGSGIVGMVDYVTGPGGAFWAGIEIPLPLEGLSLYLAGGLPNARGEVFQHAGGLYYEFDF